jgi:hypothetical protein
MRGAGGAWKGLEGSLEKLAKTLYLQQRLQHFKSEICVLASQVPDLRLSWRNEIHLSVV